MLFNQLDIAAFAITLLLSLALVLTQRWHGRFSMDNMAGVQKMHTIPTPRVGGLAIALQVNDSALAGLCFAIAAVALGFGAINWPFGKLFLGDGGAYLLGFLVGWVAVLLPMRHLQINVWATLLVCAYPALEVAFSVRRRRKRLGHHPGQPDKAHLHHFIHRRLVPRLALGRGATLRNGFTSPFCWLYAALPATWAVVFAQSTPMLVLGLILVTLAYSGLYARLTHFGWCFRALTKRRPASTVPHQ
jgi:UDP-N-acetylmuramyl pentapeptide phosphotransferase/UDP-N-acetylglucosamine-1-phosphate transferase